MSLQGDLLKLARQLATREPKRPRQASLRRAVSTAYYALFHLLISDAAARLVPGADRRHLRNVVARAFGHAEMKDVCRQFANGSPSSKVLPGLNQQPVQPALKAVALAFVDLQQARHEADYNLSHRLTRQETLDLVERAEQAFVEWQAVRKTVPADAFLVALLVQKQLKS